MKTVIGKYGMEIYRTLLCLAVFLIAVLTGGETARIAPFAFVLIVLLSLGLALFKHVRYLTLPFLLLCLLLIFCYDSYSVFIGYVWLLPLPVLGLIVHLVRIKPHLQRGPTLLPLIAVSVATLLGGIGMISAEDYFRPAALFFVIGLGPGLVFSYWILKNEVRGEADRNALATDLLHWGLVAAAIVFWHNVPLFFANGLAQLFSPPQWSNNISTMLMIALPAAFITKNRRLYHYLFACLMLAAGLLAGSRGAQLFIGLEMVLCCLWAWRTEQDPIKRLWSRTFFIYALLAVGYMGYVVCMNMNALGFFNTSEMRWSLLARGFADFAENPLFGSGLGYRGNADLYSGKQGTINWYHISLAQIVGGLGICGILAWGYQLLARFRLAWQSRKTPAFGFALCYLGLFLMSLVNPGEFCPVPYAFLAVYCFVMLESVTQGQGNEMPHTALRVRLLARRRQTKEK